MAFGFFKMFLFVLVVHLLATPLGVFGQDASLWVQGRFEDATVSGDAYNAGGAITVNGFTMNIPQNLLVQFPAAWVPWKDFVASKAEFIGFETLVRVWQSRKTILILT